MAVNALRFVLGDQLSPDISALRGADPARDVVLMVEAAEETTYVRHHRKKIVFILAAMRAFAAELKGAGWRVEYVKLDDPANVGAFTGELSRAVARLAPKRIIATEAGEHRVLAAQRAWSQRLRLPVEVREDDRFICSHADFAGWAGDKRQLRMEFFYRAMRRRTGLLMDGDQPTGGRWNFDKDNRKPARDDLFLPQPPRFPPSATTNAVIDLVRTRFPDGFGALDDFWFAITRADAEKAFAYFLKAALPRFGELQDAMLTGAPFLHHAVCSLYLNAGLLDPLDMCRRAEVEYRSGRAPLNSVEGFIRQILGWREYARGIYWREGAAYMENNYLQAHRPLPWMYWSGETNMACMAASLGQTIEHAYAHHIQRLMVTGNFALIAGIEPKQVHEWYLAVYADAYELVEAPNTIGMSLFADGGLLGSKPYAASGAYIDRMSDYCGGCRYDVKQKIGERACPFNYLYWDFLARHWEKLAGNPRIAQIYRAYDRMDAARKEAIAQDAQRFLSRLDADGTDAQQ